MATLFSHAIVALALGKGFTAERMPIRFWVASVVCAMLPDIDVIGFGFGVRYGDLLGHRGLTHSIIFALLVGVATVTLLFREARLFSRTWFGMVTYFFLVTASHALLDALTNGGLGVAFFAPFDNTRYFFPWTPIEVSPIGLRFFSERGVVVILSEVIWIWIPSAVFILTAWEVRRIVRK